MYTSVLNDFDEQRTKALDYTSVLETKYLWWKTSSFGLTLRVKIIADLYDILSS